MADQKQRLVVKSKGDRARRAKQAVEEKSLVDDKTKLGKIQKMIIGF